VAALDMCLVYAGRVRSFTTGAVTGWPMVTARMAEKPGRDPLCTSDQGWRRTGQSPQRASRSDCRSSDIDSVTTRTYHPQYDCPLHLMYHGFARPVSGWVHSSRAPDLLPQTEPGPCRQRCSILSIAQR